MKANTLFQACVFFCISVILFTLCVSFVNDMGVFPVTVEAGFNVRGNESQIFSDITNLDDKAGGSGMGALWNIAIGTSLAAVAGIVVAWVTHSTNVLSVFLFGGVFWSSYLNSMSILSLNNFLPVGFIVVGTVGMFFVFAGAVIGILGGGG